MWVFLNNLFVTTSANIIFYVYKNVCVSCGSPKLSQQHYKSLEPPHKVPVKCERTHRWLVHMHACPHVSVVMINEWMCTNFRHLRYLRLTILFQCKCAFYFFTLSIITVIFSYLYAVFTKRRYNILHLVYSLYNSWTF